MRVTSWLRMLGVALSMLASLCVGGWSQTPTQYNIAGNLSGVGTVGSDLLQVRFSLVNCGTTATPVVTGVTMAIVRNKLFTADSGGNITGTLWGSDQISCNLGYTTGYQVQYLRNNVPVTGLLAVYRITSATLTSGTWNLTTATPVQSLPPVNVLASGYECPTGQWMAGLTSAWSADCQTAPAGPVGPAPNLAIGTVTTGDTGTPASATITGSSPNYLLNMVLPRGLLGPTGPTGPAPNLAIGTVTTLSAGAQATVTITGSSPNYLINLGLPTGAAGPPTGGNVIPTVVTVTGNTTVPTDTSARLYRCNGGSGSTITITLPSAPSAGQVVYVKNVGSGAVTVAGGGSIPVDGQSTISMPAGSGEQVSLLVGYDSVSNTWNIL